MGSAFQGSLQPSRVIERLAERAEPLLLMISEAGTDDNASLATLRRSPLEYAVKISGGWTRDCRSSTMLSQ